MSHDDVVLRVDERTMTGKKVKQLRNDGKVPAVVYDHGKTTHVSAEAGPLNKAFLTVGRSQPLELELEGKKHLAMFKQIDRHPVKQTLRHVSFLAIKRNEKVDAEVPIKIVLDEGNESTPAERAGLIVLRTIESVAIKALPRDLPEELTVNGENLVEVGDKLTVADIKLPAGVEYADAELDLEQVIASAYEPSAIAAANEEAGGDAEPEDVEEVEAEHGEDTNQPANADEGKGDGRKQFEQKGE